MIDNVTLIGQVGQVTVVLKPVAEVAENFGYSRYYIKRLCQEGELIAIKYAGLWFCEEHLSQTGSLTTLQDTG